MKKTFLKIVALFAVVAATTSSVLAQGSFAYQAVIRDSKGELVSNQEVNLQLSLMESKTAVYVETQKTKTNQYGNISVMVGAGTVVSGDFNKVPWNTMNIMMKVEVDVKGGSNFKEVGEIQLQPVPYAFYAASAGSMVVSGNGGEKEPIFSVKDDNGDLVFAVYNDGVKVFVDDTDASKAAHTGFAVSGRKAAKEGETNDYFVVNGNGTQVYVDVDATSSKAVHTGFAVSGRKAAKDGSADLFTVNSDGTQVFIDEDSTKAVHTGFAVSGRKAAKDGVADDYFTINTATGTQIYIDDTDSSKAAHTGFAVSGRKAAKDGVVDDYLTINAEGTQVFVDEDSKAAHTGFAVSGRKAAKDGSSASLFTVNGSGTQVFIDEDSTKAAHTGFAVSGRKAAKDEAEDYFTINTTEGTQVFVDDDETKAAHTGFAVSGRKAAKDGEPELLLKVDATGTQVFIDDESKAAHTGFAVSGRKAAKDSVGGVDYLYINGDTTQFKSSSFLVKEKDSDVNLLSMSNSSTNFKSSSFSVSEKGSDESLLAVANGNVHINSDMLMSGDVEKKVDIKMVKDPVKKEVKLNANAEGYELTTNDLFTDIETLSLLKIVGEAPAMVQDGVLYFTADGAIAKTENEAVITVSLSNNTLVAVVDYAKVAKDVVVTFGVQNGLTDGVKVIATFKK